MTVGQRENALDDPKSVVMSASAGVASRSSARSMLNRPWTCHEGLEASIASSRATGNCGAVAKLLKQASSS